ncbi:Panacea domain-containing protein [Brachyspira innocens]|uniref:Panacea domain-containing protein n=1 Tax=Brachyspira innocens TaxID=13264 RepID=UPI0026EE052A|nr:Panacea domain-containing protein [Brachyspira innocens]
MNMNLALMILLITKNNKYDILKINKLLYMSDIFYYIKYGETISKNNYIKYEYDIVPSNIAEIISILVNNELLDTECIEDGLYKEKLYVSSPNVNFEKVRNDLDSDVNHASNIINDVVNNLKEYGYPYLSEIVHRYEPNVDVNNIINFNNINNNFGLKKWFANNHLNV